MNMKYFILTLIGSAAVAGCTVGPDYHKPPNRSQANFNEAGNFISTNPPPADWWTTFKDSELNKLIAEALRENYDLKAASARLRQSRFQRNLAAADLFPQVAADGGYARSHGSKNVTLPLGGSRGSPGGSGSGSQPQTKTTARAASKAGNQSSGSQSTGSDGAFDNQLNPFGKGGLPGADTDLYQVGFDASWEIDVFGGKRREVEAATAEVQAANEKRHDLALTLVAEVARNYFELRGLQARLEIAKKNLEAEKEILALTRSRSGSGLATEADTARVSALVATVAATIPSLEAGAGKLIHALSTLVARDPAALQQELVLANPLPAFASVEVPVGLPSQLMERRPDIRQAEREIAAANARIGSAQSDLFPKFALIGTAGLDSSKFANLFEWDSRYFLISPTVTWRIFDAGRVISNIGLQKAITQEAALHFQSVELRALQEVEDALISYATERERVITLETAVTQNQLARELVRQRYDHGLATFLDVLDTERTFLSAEDALAESNLSLNTDLVSLFKALGGGWEAQP